MEITDVRVRRVDTQGKLRAYVTVTFDHCFVVHNVKVIEGSDRLFIAMPSRKTRSGEFKDVAHPISSEFRNAMQERIVAEYEAQAVAVRPEHEADVAQAGTAQQPADPDTSEEPGSTDEPTHDGP